MNTKTRGGCDRSQCLLEVAEHPARLRCQAHFYYALETNLKWNTLIVKMVDLYQSSSTGRYECWTQETSIPHGIENTEVKASQIILLLCSFVFVWFVLFWIWLFFHSTFSLWSAYLPHSPQPISPLSISRSRVTNYRKSSHSLGSLGPTSLVLRVTDPSSGWQRIITEPGLL